MDIIITDMDGSSIEHSTVIVNFVNIVYNQLKDSTCRVFSDNVQYKWKAGDTEKTVIPDASINCQVKSRKGNSFINAQQFIMEVLSPSTEKYDREETKSLYCEQEINEYWIVNWQRREIEIYDLDYENEKPNYYLISTVKDDNKDGLKLTHFPIIRIDFDKLFDV